MQDFFKGFVVAVLTVVLSGIYTIVQAGQLPTLAQLQGIGLAGLAAGIAYIFKNFFTNNQGQMLTKDAPPPQPEIPGGKG
jgi:hypothetical protein